MFNSKLTQNRRKMRVAFIKMETFFADLRLTNTKHSKFYYSKVINFIYYLMSTLYMPDLELDFIFVLKEFTSL